MKQIYFYHLNSKTHSATRLMINNPPTGYRFVLPENNFKLRFMNFMISSNFIKFIYQKIIKKIFNPFKINEAVYSTRIPANIDLVFSARPLNIDRPYVLEILDHPAALTGYDYAIFIKNNKDIQKELLSRFCKRIIVVNESSYKLMKKYFNKGVIKKTVLIRAAVKKQNFKKDYNKKILQILFIGSMANPDDFYIKGGLEALESFSKISKKFNNIRIIIRCKIPNEIKARYGNLRNVQFIEESLNQKKWSKILKESDICLNPGHVYPLMAILESMSHGIPIIVLNTWSVRDYLINEKNSILIKPSDKISLYKSEEYPLNIRSKEFINQIKELDEKVVDRICEALKKLITNPELRRKLGSNGKKMIENKFSLGRRNKQLKKIFDEASNISLT